MTFNRCINRRLLKGRNYRGDADEDLLDGLEEARVETRCHQMMQQRSLLMLPATGVSNYNNLEWVREALVTLLKSNSIMRKCITVLDEKEKLM
ncbi:hypothetical protein PHMEG_00023304 [Phytophthora megakarya]|uniref:Uncharacterized protein n=1 Tax=Phytophthora megakarya TaxID=4795 RepID=A0A225VHE5_9STRA|nr:hypothetical protein PHMEG_00023304 [Phytophthora megakarya]